MTTTHSPARTSLTVDEARAAVVAAFQPLASEVVRLESALHRVLAKDVISPIDLPRWDNSSMDGYAVRAADITGASADIPVTLPVTATIAAGGSADHPLAAGTAMRIMTGAPIPVGADTVVRIEDTDRGEEQVAIRDIRDSGRNVRPRGEDLRSGEIALTAGTLIEPPQLGVLASLGAHEVTVHARPTVAVLSTGDELVDVDAFAEVAAGRRIVSSNSYTIRAALTAAGTAVLDLGIARDDRETLREKLETARDSGCDLLITSGGVSVGAFDFTREVLATLGATMHFWRVRIRPGGPLGFGRLGSTPWLGLPGNPVSAMVTFELFARPAIRTLRGERAVFPRTITVIVDEDVTIAAPLTHFLRVVLVSDDSGSVRARLTGPQGSGLLTSMARADALLIVPLEYFGRAPIPAGTALRAIPLGERAGVTTNPML